MNFVTNLECKSCKKQFSPGFIWVCDSCFGPLKVNYNLESIKERINRSELSTRSNSINRYSELLPVKTDFNYPLNHIGNTPLRKISNLGDDLGLKNLYLKDDGTNPTGSFKDRPASVAIAKALEFGLSTVACVSTGNLAAATASAASIAKLDCKVIIPTNLDQQKVQSTLVYSPELISIDGSYDQINRKANLIADEEGWVFVNINLRPYYLEGSKTLIFEVLEQLDWEIPDHVIIPLGSGALLEATRKGIDEFHDLDFISEKSIKLNGVQGHGCSPIVDAFVNNDQSIYPVQYPKTIAKSLAIGDPASGLPALDSIRVSQGWADNPTDEEIIAGQILLAKKEGIFAEQTGGLGIASLKRKIEDGSIDPTDTIVVFNTAHGLKTLETIQPFLLSTKYHDQDTKTRKLSTKVTIN